MFRVYASHNSDKPGEVHGAKCSGIRKVVFGLSATRRAVRGLGLFRTLALGQAREGLKAILEVRCPKPKTLKALNSKTLHPQPWWGFDSHTRTRLARQGFRVQGFGFWAEGFCPLLQRTTPHGRGEILGFGVWSWSLFCHQPAS